MLWTLPIPIQHHQGTLMDTRPPQIVSPPFSAIHVPRVHDAKRPLPQAAKPLTERPGWLARAWPGCRGCNSPAGFPPGSRRAVACRRQEIAHAPVVLDQGPLSSPSYCWTLAWHGGLGSYDEQAKRSATCDMRWHPMLAHSKQAWLAWTAMHGRASGCTYGPVRAIPAPGCLVWPRARHTGRHMLTSLPAPVFRHLVVGNVSAAARSSSTVAALAFLAA